MTYPSSNSPAHMHSRPQPSPEVIPGSGDDVDGALKVLQSGEDGVMVDDDSFNELVDVGLARDLVVALGDRHQGGTKTDGQVVGVHHVLLAVLRQAVWKGKKSRLEGITSSLFLKHVIYTNLTMHTNKHDMSFIAYITPPA